MNAKFRNSALAAFCIASVLVLSPSRTQAAVTFSIESSFSDIEGNESFWSALFDWDVWSVDIDDLSLDVGDSAVFQYGVFRTADFPILPGDSLDDDDYFQANLLIDPPGALVSGVGEPDATSGTLVCTGWLEWEWVPEHVDVVFSDDPITVNFDQGSYTVKFLSLYGLTQDGDYDLEAEITLTSYVPEPASMLVWTFLGLAVCGGLCWSQRKRG